MVCLFVFVRYLPLEEVGTASGGALHIGCGTGKSTEGTDPPQEEGGGALLEHSVRM